MVLISQFWHHGSLPVAPTLHADGNCNGRQPASGHELQRLQRARTGMQAPTGIRARILRVSTWHLDANSNRRQRSMWQEIAAGIKGACMQELNGRQGFMQARIPTAYGRNCNGRQRGMRAGIVKGGYEHEMQQTRARHPGANSSGQGIATVANGACGGGILQAEVATGTKTEYGWEL